MAYLNGNKIMFSPTVVLNGVPIGEQKEYDRFWDAYQNYGKRRNYQGGFSGEGWTVDTFKPKYDIVTSSEVSYVFRFSRVKASLIDILKTQGISLDFTDATMFISTFYNSYFTELPAIMPNNPVYYSATFQNMPYLRKIEKLRIVETTTFSGPFSSCPNLEELTIVGVIGMSNFSVEYNTKLTHDSVMSIINALKDYSGTGNTRVVKLGGANLKKLSDSEKAIATGKGWTLA